MEFIFQCGRTTTNVTLKGQGGIPPNKKPLEIL